jgi:hypothetical protein
MEDITMPFASHILTILSIVPMGLLTVARTKPAVTQDAIPGSEKEGFAGSWWVTYFETEGPATRALFTLSVDGTMITAEHPVVTPPGAPSVIFTSTGHGSWTLTSPDNATFTFMGLGSDLHGKLWAVVTYRGTIALDAAGQTLSGEFVATISDPEGNMLASFPMTLTGSRIVAETSANKT